MRWVGIRGYKNKIKLRNRGAAINGEGDKGVYRQVKGDAEDHLMKVIKSVLRKIKNRADISDETLDYFFVNNPN